METMMDRHLKSFRAHVRRARLRCSQERYDWPIQSWHERSVGQHRLWGYTGKGRPMGVAFQKMVQRGVEGRERRGGGRQVAGKGPAWSGFAAGSLALLHCKCKCRTCPQIEIHCRKLVMFYRHLEPEAFKRTSEKNE